MMRSWSNRVWSRAAEHPLTIVFVFALCVRLINLALLTGRDAFFAEQDAFGYWALGAALAKPDTFWPTLLSLTDRMPLYLLLLAGVQHAFGDLPRVVALVQAVIDAGTCTFIAALGALISPLPGLIVGLLAALSVTLVVFSTQILTDSLFVFFFTLMLLAGARFLLRPTMGLALGAGLAGGLALATRPSVAMLLAAGVPLVFVIALVRRWNVGPALAAALLFALAAAAPIAPVLARNAVHYHSLSVTSQTGDYLALWIVPLVTERADGTPYQATFDRMDALYRQQAGTESNPFRRSAIASGLAWQEMARLPPAALAKAWLESAVVNLTPPALLPEPRLGAPRRRAAHDKAVFDPFEDAPVVRTRRAAHIEDAAEARIPDLNVAGGPHELHGRERVHRHARRADRMTLGLEPARGIDRQGSVLLGKPLGHGARALSLRDQAHRLVFHQLGDGEAIVGLDEGKGGERDAGARQRARPGLRAALELEHVALRHGQEILHVLGCAEGDRLAELERGCDVRQDHGGGAVGNERAVRALERTRHARVLFALGAAELVAEVLANLGIGIAHAVLVVLGGDARQRVRLIAPTLEIARRDLAENTRRTAVAIGYFAHVGYL